MKPGPASSLLVRIIVFLVWPVVAPAILILFAALLIAVWPYTLFRVAYQDSDHEPNQK